MSSVRVDLKFKPISTSVTSHNFVLIAENKTRIIEICFSDFRLLSFGRAQPAPLNNPFQRVLVFYASWPPLGRCASFARTSFSRDEIHWVVPKNFTAGHRSLFLEADMRRIFSRSFAAIQCS